jgi:hypothetical protein
MGTEVACHRCGQTWPRDPRLEVACPACLAAVGRPCLRPSGHATWGGIPHVAREQLAVDRGILSHRCPAITTPPLQPRLL